MDIGVEHAESFMTDDECLLTLSSLKFTRFPFKVKAYTFIKICLLSGRH